jgi:hypothetical protein
VDEVTDTDPDSLEKAGEVLVRFESEDYLEVQPKMKGLERVFNVQYSVLLQFEWMFRTVVRISPNRLSPAHADAPHAGCMYAQQLLAICSHNGKY